MEILPKHFQLSSFANPQNRPVNNSQLICNPVTYIVVIINGPLSSRWLNAHSLVSSAPALYPTNYGVGSSFPREKNQQSMDLRHEMFITIIPTGSLRNIS